MALAANAPGADERAQTQLEVYRLGQAYALIRALEQLEPTETPWESVRDIPATAMQEAFASVRGPSGDIEPSDEDLAAARRDLAEE